MSIDPLPPPPEHLTGAQAARWRTIIARAGHVDTSLLAAWVIAEDQHIRAATAQAQLDGNTKLPLLTKDAKGRAVASPYLAVIADAATQMTRLARAMGFNPASAPAPLAANDPEPDPALTCNKRELARLLGVSLPTISAYLDRWADFPVVQNGTTGREWRFDPLAVRDYLAAKEAEEEAYEARRQAEIDQLAMPLESVSDGPSEINPGDRLKLIRSLAAEDDLRLKRGFLVSVPAERQALTAAVARWNRAQLAAVRQAGRDYSLPDAVVRGLVDRFAEAQTQLIADLKLEAGLAERRTA
jgi:phage terminase Nu1 subunit (DNA packaging protein)